MALPPGIPTFRSDSTGNHTRPDNVFVSPDLLELIVRCDTIPEDKPGGTDHYPIILTLDILIMVTVPPPRPNFRAVDWPEFRKELEEHIKDIPVDTPVLDVLTFRTRLTALYTALKRTIEAKVPTSRPSAFVKRWWTKELDVMKGKKARLGRKSYNTRAEPLHPNHKDYKRHRNKYTNALFRTKSDHWLEFLADLDERTMWPASHIASSTPSDGSKTRVPDLNCPDGTKATEKPQKAQAFHSTCFPPANPNLPTDDFSLYTYPQARFDFQKFTKQQIQSAIDRLSPYKATCENQISNCILKRCPDLLIPILQPLFNASIQLGYHPHEWRDSSTIILRKPGKPSYLVPKAYRPIELLCAIGKLMASLVAEDLPKHLELDNNLPSHQFGCRPGRSTVDSLHYVTSWIKNAWRRQQVVVGLFLDISGAFPSVIVPKLVHILRKKGVPTKYTDWIGAKGSRRNTTIAFDDFKSQPTPYTTVFRRGAHSPHSPS